MRGDLFKYFLLGAVVVFVLLLGLYFYLATKETKLISPILEVSKIRFADNIWFPKQSKFVLEASGKLPEVSAHAAFFVETQTGEVLYEKNSRQKLSVASLVKIMTVIITLENRGFDDVLTVSERAAAMEPDKMFLLPGEKMTVENLLEGVFLVSANDGAEVLAEQTTGVREEFIGLMNSKAVQLGMKDSNFINPTGLEEKGSKQLSTAYDVALMARYAIRRWPQLLAISSKPYVYIPVTDTHQDYEMFSGINLLTTYPGVIGFKTGFTPEAGLTLVTIARREGREVLGVILGSVNRRDDAKTLLDYSFSKLGVE